MLIAQELLRNFYAPTQACLRPGKVAPPQHEAQRIEAKIRELGRRLENFPHHRLQWRPEFRLRAGDCRIIYQFNLQQNILYLVTLGHRKPKNRGQNRLSSILRLAFCPNYR